jgi:threonine synthase
VHSPLFSAPACVPSLFLLLSPPIGGVVLSFFIVPIDTDMKALEDRTPASEDDEAEDEEEETPMKTLLSAPTLLFKDLRMLLLVPLIIYSGFEMAFMW